MMIDAILPADSPLPPDADRRFFVDLVDGFHIVRDRTTGMAVNPLNGGYPMAEIRVMAAADVLERNHHGLDADRLVLASVGGPDDPNEWAVFALLPPWTDNAKLAAAVTFDIPAPPRGSPVPPAVLADVRNQTLARPVETASKHLRHLCGAIEMADEHATKTGEHIRVLTGEAMACVEVLEMQERTAPDDVAADLLAACVYVADWLPRYIDLYGDPTARLGDFKRRLDAAIAKARGGA